ncbi:MAG: DUF2948 family protein [Rhodospirillales bacterium]|nr:DUF2948 family protein [Rhodospirillales bacterium]
MANSLPPKGLTGRLRVRAEDDDDLAVLSACLQDGLVAVRDIAYLPAERRLVLIVNRYRWEAAEAGQLADGTGDARGERVICALAMDGVQRVRQQGIDRGKPGQFLSILQLRRVVGAGAPGPADPPAVEIVFAGQAAIRVTLDRFQVRAEDVEEPYPTAWRPKHKLDDPAPGTS